MCIDSCGPRGGCTPLAYLEAIGVNVEAAVKWIVASHWHDDHVRGLALLVERCREARFFYPSALGTREFQTIAAIHSSGDPNQFVSATSEISRVFSHLIGTNRQWAIAHVDRLICRTAQAKVHSLSPSDTQYRRFVASIGRLIPSASPPTARRRLGALEPNDTAVVIQAETTVGNVIFGSDLEEQTTRGWTDLMNGSQAALTGNGVFKVAHHGSQNAHAGQFWLRYRATGCISIMTPFNLGSVRLPTPGDIDRINSLSEQAFISADSNARPAEIQTTEVARALREDGIRFRRSEPRVGHIRLRCSPDDRADWRVELFNGASSLKVAA